MEEIRLRVHRMEHFRGALPEYQTPRASGFDIRAQLDSPITIEPGRRVLVPTGLIFEIPDGYEIQVRPRSGLAWKAGIGVVNSPGTIDSDYRGEVQVILINWGTESFQIQDQDRIAQLVLCPIVRALFEDIIEIEPTGRGAGGFGSTGI